MKQLISIFLILCLFGSCSKDENTPEPVILKKSAAVNIFCVNSP